MTASAASAAFRDGALARGVDPRSGSVLEPGLPVASPAGIREVCRRAAAAFPVWESWLPAARARAIRAIASDLRAQQDALSALFDQETALGHARAQTELARTCAQLDLFAGLLEDGSYVDARIDHPSEPNGPDLRRMLVGLGPVLVFGASNFPLAFGVPGGDTASALAAGCTVITKSHEAHPRTAQLCAELIGGALDRAGAPPGTFANVHGPGETVGQALARASEIAAIGFTGSRRAGRALMDAAAARGEPIPVFAEMGSLNPVFICPRALATRPQSIAAALLGSLAQGLGQFCTKPGVLFIPDGAGAETFIASLAAGVKAADGGWLLTDAIRVSFQAGLSALRAVPGVEVIQADLPERHGFSVQPAIAATSIATYLKEPRLRDELFGPAAIVVTCGSPSTVLQAAELMDGSLTATVQADPADADLVAALAGVLRRRAGRVIYNGVPTGVAVTRAQQHGGPYPAASNAGFTSVGTAAITRFLRPIAYQDVPDALLPPALRDRNPLGILRLVDGEATRG